MRDRETIDSELRLIALERRSSRDRGGPSSQRVDELLDERLGHRPVAATGAAAATGVTAPTRAATPRRRRSGLRRLGPLAALPLSLIAVAGAVVVMFAVRKPPLAPEPTEVPPSAAAPAPAAPQAAVPTPDIAGKALTDALKQQGVPVPSNDYVAAQGHAVCEFLKKQPDFAAAVRFVQQSSIWDADQSTAVTAGAIVSYCPQVHPASPDTMQPNLQKALSDLQAIEGKLQGIQGDLHGIEGDLPALPGHG
ncbi:DUF732 domain-containing protein [Mycobacterium helveticum]|jgi:hypothetical protein|uniref:DUF732 domain-containing protein n=1 Tax=Mycobacterium helveticum TaxID=2592811 RepID=A0A557XSQ5_9MYCO|nr:DUF732 domain-containing protein [Mycobacterium helveticum]TVS77812.1 DUF732 domain-containing protein [Mycobacterium helveticum]TVS88998.1 DUF732 domain-containing protein [Mycobacterium helveticum]